MKILFLIIKIRVTLPYLIVSMTIMHYDWLSMYIICVFSYFCYVQMVMFAYPTHFYDIQNENLNNSDTISYK